MRNDERQSLARAKRAARLAQRAADVLGSMAAADHWLTAPCAALRGKAPRDVRFDETGARRVAVVLRHRASRQRMIRSACLHAFENDAMLTAWLWKKNRALGNRRPAMLLDTDRGARAVLKNLGDRKDMRAARAGTAAVRKHGTVAWSKVKRDLNRL